MHPLRSLQQSQTVFSSATLRIFPVCQYTCHSKWLTRIRSRITSLRVTHLILSVLLFYRSARMNL